MSPEALVALSERVLSAWFYDARFKAAWRPEPALFLLPAHAAMAELMAARGPSLTDVGLTLEMRRMGQLELFPGLGPGSAEQGANAIAQIVLGVPVVLDPWEALGQLREAVAVRALRAGLLRAAAGLDDGQGLAEGRNAVAGLLRATEAATGGSPENLRQALADEIRRELGPARPRGCPTGSALLDNLTGGICPGDVWCIGAPTSWGKSSYLCALLRLAVASDRRVLIVSGEDPVGLYSQRVLTGLTGVNATRARDATLRPDERSLVSNALSGVADYPFFLSAIGKTIEAVAADVRSVLASSDVSGDRWLVCLDYIQAFRSCVRHQDRRTEIVYCDRQFTDAVKQSGAAGMIMSQITKDASGRPKMRDCEDLIHAAEVGLYGQIEDTAALDHDGRKISDKGKSFLVAKNKNGPSGFTIPLPWDDDGARFMPEHEPVDEWLQ
jgi:replicative DNA helicase